VLRDVELALRFLANNLPVLLVTHPFTATLAGVDANPTAGW
ncbi:uncharacterized protein METZ01_LOCUS89952, partial [marine metagenome]